MRVWDMVPPHNLCRQHLLAQWREGLGLWNILTQGKKGYSNHPETKRWIGHERLLWNLLSRTRKAMVEPPRNWNPKPLPEYPVWVSLQPNDPTGRASPTPWDDQLSVLRGKACECEVPE